MVTVLILAVGCLAAMKIQTAASTSNAMAGEVNVASVLAESELERVKSLSRQELLEEANNGPKVEDNLDRFGLACAKGPCPGTRFKRTVRYFPRKVTALSTQVEVEISWKSLVGPRNLIRGTVVTFFSL
jgi:Tfp pilus assembly protein PilV